MSASQDIPQRQSPQDPPGPMPAASLDPALRFRLAHDLMSATPAGQSRLRAFFLSRRLECCATLADLRDLRDEEPEAFAPVAGRLEELLGPRRG